MPGGNWPSRYLLAQSQQRKYHNNLWNMFRVNNKEHQDDVELRWYFNYKFEHVSHFFFVILLLTLSLYLLEIDPAVIF